MPQNDVMILSCARDAEITNLLVRGIHRFWPEVRPRVVMDTDRATETELPDDIRTVIRERLPYLRKFFDLPLLAESETVYILDADCLLYRHPRDFGPRAFQGTYGGPDLPAGLDLWREMGVEIDSRNMRFCSGVFSAGKEMWTEGREAGIEWVRRCIAKGYDKVKYPGVVCEQSLVAGLWRQRYPNNPLPPGKYPYQRYVNGCTLWHISSGDYQELRETQAMISAYKALI